MRNKNPHVCWTSINVAVARVRDNPDIDTYRPDLQGGYISQSAIRGPRRNKFIMGLPIARASPALCLAIISRSPHRKEISSKTGFFVSTFANRLRYIRTGGVMCDLIVP